MHVNLITEHGNGLRGRTACVFLCGNPGMQ